MAKKKIEKQDFLTFSNVSDIRANIPAQERNLGDELYKKNWQSQTIDSFEKSLGVRPKISKANLKYKSRIFSPDYDKDATLLNELMNHPKYSILYWKDNWTVEGLYKVFAIYSENLDYKEPEQLVKDISEGKE
jgi:hypothetical protein